jgi:hypothetical protein
MRTYLDVPYVCLLPAALLAFAATKAAARTPALLTLAGMLPPPPRVALDPPIG